MLLAAGLSPTRGQPASQPTSQPASQPVEFAPPTTQAAEAIEAEVYQNVIHQSVDGWGVQNLNLPEPFLRRVTDRIVRESYEDRYRIVVGEATTMPASQLMPAPATKPLGGVPVTVIGIVIVIAVAGVWLIAKRQAR